jgi:glyoxylase-like metal-dependent hydrolase (beta-lactamase superfamily II)
VGLAPELIRPGRRIFISETDGLRLPGYGDDAVWEETYAEYVENGFNWEEIARLRLCNPAQNAAPIPCDQYNWLQDGHRLRYGGRERECVLTPGHTPGHMCLYDEANRRLICGDHILGLITPNITIELSLENPLQAYLESLAKVDVLEVDELLTTHGIPVDDMHQRIAELYHHHEVRLAEVVKILGDEWKNAYETARDMTWEIDCRNWDEFPAPQKWFATGEAISHLQYLYFTGKVDREEHNGVYHYRNRKAD